MRGSGISVLNPLINNKSLGLTTKEVWGGEIVGPHVGSFPNCYLSVAGESVMHYPSLREAICRAF